MNYLIYGANSAIGSHLARSVLPFVDKLYLFYHQRTDRLKETRQALSLLDHHKVVAIQSDIRDYEDFNQKLCQLSIANCQLSAVYLPAIRSSDHKPLSETSIQQTNEIIDVNLKGAIHFLKTLLQLRRGNNNSPLQSGVEPYTRIILLGSNISRTGLPYGSIYAATKAALANLVRSVALEEGKNGVLINCVSPGPVNTDTKYSDDYAHFRKEYFETQKQQTSLNKLASVEDVCAMIRFLTSDENTHITGEEIFITGGAL